MRAVISILLFALPASVAASAPPVGTAVGSKVPHFTAPLLDGAGKEKATFDSHRTSRVTAYIFIGTTCPATKAYLERLRELEATYRPKRVDFVYLYPNRTDTAEAKRTFHEASRLAGSLVDDVDGRVARLLGAERTSEVVLADKDGTIVYRGGVDDARDPAAVRVRYLRTALDEHLAGKPVSVTTSTVFA